MTKTSLLPNTLKETASKPAVVGAFFAVLLLVRNFWMFWGFSFAFYPDSNLYVHLGAQLFRTWYISPLVTFPYPLINALTRSYDSPTLLIWFQMLLGSAVGGFFVYVAARRDLRFAMIAGVFLLLDLVWGSLSRSILTDGLFATFSLLAVALLLLHYDRREKTTYLELAAAGAVYALAISIRPSHIFLAVVFPPLYAWLTRSWKKVFTLLVGFGLFFSVVGLINLRGSGEFYVLSSKGGYTNDYLVFPLFVYQLYSPENGPASAALQGHLEACLPGENVLEMVDRSPGGAFDSVNNMELMNLRVIPCLQSRAEDRGFISGAYLEALTANPLHFSGTILQETAVYLRYGNPYILRWQNNAGNNYGCTEMAWCGTIRESRLVWDHQKAAVGLYEKAAVKVFQAYLAPVGLVSAVSPDKLVFPYLFMWVATALFALFFGRGRCRFLALVIVGFVSYTAVVVVTGLGFTERYASMLAPLQTVYSAVVWYTLFLVGMRLWKAARARFAPGPALPSAG